MSQRYFLTAESTYEDLRQSLNVALAYPNELGKSVFQTALYAPRDTFRRVLLAVDTDLPGYATINAAIAPLLASDAMEEIDEATYLAALATATAGASNFSSVTDTLTYVNFLPEGGSLATALSGIDTAISGKAAAATGDFTNPAGWADSALALFDYVTGAWWLRASDGDVIFETGYAAAMLAALGAASQSHAHTAADITDFSSAVASASPEEVVECAATTNFPGTGNTSLLYIATDSSRFYRWTGSEYVEVGPVALYPAAHTHAASDITSGTISPARLPITSGTAAPTGGADGDIYLQYTA